MKKASNVRLSLRKLCVAMLAVGPLAVLPSPLLAAVPGSTPFTVTNGTGTWTTAGANSATVQASDKAVLVWGAGNFTIAGTDTFNFSIPSGGAVLNKVGYTTTGALAAADNVVIDGTLFSTGRVFIVANGAISIGGAAVINSIGGVVLSTLQEASDFPFTTGGNLSLTGASLGAITIGNATASPTITGNLEATAGSLVVHRGSVTGDLILKSVTSGAGVVLGQSAGLAVSGNMSVTTNNGTITDGTGPITVGSASGNQTTTLSTGSSGNVAITLDVATNDFEIVSITAPGTAGHATIADANIIILGNSTVGGNLQVNVTGAVDSTAIATGGLVAVTGTSNFTTATANSNINIGSNSTFTGAVNATVTNSTVTINAAGPLTVGNIDVGTGNRAGINLTAQTGALTLNGALTAIGNGTTSQSINLTGGSIVQSGTGTISLTAASGSVVSYNATAGGISIGGTVTAPRVTANTATANGTITQSAVITTSNTTATSTFNAGAGAITLNQSNAFAAGHITQFTGSTVQFTNTAATVLGTTNTTGNLTLNLGANALTLGTGSGTDAQNITVGGVLNVTTANGAITDNNFSRFNVFGGLNLTTGGAAVTLDAATANGGSSPNVQFGQVNINSGAGAVTVAETTSLNLGNITTTGALTAQSSAGSIVDSGTISVGAAGATFTVPASQMITIDNTGHTLPLVNVVGGNDNTVAVGATTVLGGTTNVAGNLTLTSSSGVGITLGSASGNVTVGNLTVNSGGTILVDNVVNVSGNFSLTSADTTANSITDSATGKLGITGTATLASTGGVVLDGNVDFNTVTLNGITGNTVISDNNGLTVSGNAAGAVQVASGAGTGAIAGPWALTLGNLNVSSLNASAGAGGGGDSGSLTQLAGTSLHVENLAQFTTTDANLILGNDGNSFGRLEATISSPSASRTLTLVEDGTMKVGIISSRGSSTVTSRFGSIIEDTANNVTVTNNGTLTLNAANGNVLLGNTTHTSGTTSGNVTAAVINAPSGSAAIISSNSIALGNVNANSLTVTTTGGTGNISQTGSLKVFGSANFTAAGNIVLSNTSNNFGRVSLTTTNAARNITISESGTLNLGTVAMPATSTGNFTATSVSGDIIDSGLGGVRPGGTIVGTTANTGTTVVTLSALNGDIVLNDSTTDFVTSGGVVFNANNVTLAPLGLSTLVLGSANVSSVAGNLTVTSAVGNIVNAGDLNISGAASFTTGTGNISLNSAGNRFGTVKFSGNQVSISQVNDMNIVRGSQALGPAQLASTTSYITIAPEGTENVIFGSTVSLSASGAINLPDFVKATGQLTVSAAGTKDLSALSISGDLNGLTPVSLGTGTLVPPQP